MLDLIIFEVFTLYSKDYNSIISRCVHPVLNYVWFPLFAFKLLPRHYFRQTVLFSFFFHTDCVLSKPYSHLSPPLAGNSLNRLGLDFINLIYHLLMNNQ